MQLILNCPVLNPRDNFTNFTVRWFKSTETEDDLGITTTQDTQLRFNATHSVGNCIFGPLYRDTFSLIISNFTSDKNAHYWCQIFVNHSVSWPSESAWFYAAPSSFCTRKNDYYARASPPQCAVFTYSTTTKTLLTTTVETSSTEIPNESSPLSPTSVSISLKAPSGIYPKPTSDLVATAITKIPNEISSRSLLLSSMTTISLSKKLEPDPKMKQLFYVAGFLSLFIVLLTLLVVLLLLLYIRKFRTTIHHKTGECNSPHSLFTRLLYINHTLGKSDVLGRKTYTK